MTRLRRSDPNRPGWTRQRSGRGFLFRDEHGVVLQGADRQRCRDLVIPPAWTQVWICPWPTGHIQVVGVDADGRRQYLYHPRWRIRRDAQKYERMVVFGHALPAARAVVEGHLALLGMPRERALAAGFRLMDRAGVRVGGETYARQRGSVGLATLRREHASTVGDHVHLRFPGKSGKEHELDIRDAHLAATVHALLARRSGGPELLAFQGPSGWVDLTSSDLNDYVREVMGVDVTAKDFRTWQGALRALSSLARGGQASPKRAVSAAMRDVSQHLGNTPAVARSAYVDPRIVERFEAGATLPMPEGVEAAGEADPIDLVEWEAPLLELLEG